MAWDTLQSRFNDFSNSVTQKLACGSNSSSISLIRPMLNYKQQGTPAAPSLPAACAPASISGSCVKFGTAAPLLDSQSPSPSPVHHWILWEGGGNNPLHLSHGVSLSFPSLSFLLQPPFGSIACLLRALVTVLLWALGQSEGHPLLSGDSHRLTQLPGSIPVIYSHNNHWASSLGLRVTTLVPQVFL